MDIGNNDPIRSEQALQNLQSAQVKGKSNNLILVLSKRDLHCYVQTNISERWASFDQMRMIKMKLIDSYANNDILK